MQKKLILSFFSVLIFSSISFAESIYLKDGRRIDGEIISEGKHRIQINVNGLPYTYYREQIDRIEGRGGVVPLTELINKSLKSIDHIPPQKRDLIVRFLNANGTRESVTTIFAQILEKIPDDKRETFQQVFNIDEIILRLIPVYDKYYSESDLKELITFYLGTVGKKEIESTPLIMEEVMKVTIEYFQERKPSNFESQ